MTMKYLIMRQVSKYGWILVTEAGNIVRGDMYFNNKGAAEDYAKAYISSFQDVQYRMQSL